MKNPLAKAFVAVAGAALLGLALTAGACTLPASIAMHGKVISETADPKLTALIPELEKMTRQTVGKNRIPGLSIVLVTSRGPVWEAGFGYGDDARKVPVDPDTIFSVQSMSKTFTAVGVLTGVHDGILDLDTPVSRYLPDFRVQSIFEERPQDRITVRHLLTHTAGFTHEAPVGSNYDPETPTFDQHVASIQDTWLTFRVGEQYHYSNLGIDLAAYILEKRAGRPFEDYMQARVFAPLGMTRSTEIPARILAETNRAIGHARGFGALPPICPMMGAGGVYASAHDLGAFLTFMLGEGKTDGKILSSAEFTQMETTPNNGGYGLGVAIGRRQDDLYFNHGGGGYGFLTYMAWYPTLDVGIGILTNSSNHNSAHVKLADSIVDKLVSAGAVHKAFPLTHLPVCGISLGKVKDDSWYFEAHPEQAQWKEDWQRYGGSYRLETNATPLWWANLAISVGFPRDMHVDVKHEGNGMTLDGVPLVEYQPGLFFTNNGEALDLRADPPTWRNIKLQKR
jgi:CubicO group peptidase (beta-lactamase class C family)